MGGCASKPTDGELVVAATLAPEFVKRCSSTGRLGSDGSMKSVGSYGKPEPVPATGGSGALGTADPVELLDTRDFWIEKERELAVRALGVVDTPVDDPRFNAITKLMSAIFQTPVALITLITEDRVWFKSKVGPFGACVDRSGSWCNYINVPNTPEVLITEDASEDARFAGNPYVAGAPHIKFYAGAPLVGRNGMRYGTLCVVDFKRRGFSAEMYALLSNFASLVVQELERDVSMMSDMEGEAAMLADGQQRIQNMITSALSPVALVDVRSRSWPVLYANDAFAQAEGGDSVEQVTSSGGFWDLFEPAQDSSKGEVVKAVDAAVAASRPARVPVLSKLTGQRVMVVLRPGSSDQLHPTKAIAIPNWVPSEKAPHVGCHAGALPGALDAGGLTFEGPASAVQLASCFWFVEVEGSAPVTPAASSLASAGSQASSAPGAPGTPNAAEAEAARTRGSASSLLQTFSSQPLPEALVGLEMGPLVGAGSFGRVYRGTWRDTVVAVKVIDCSHTSKASAGEAAETALHEAALSKSLDHPSIVKTYDYAMMESRGGHMLWMVQQLCNHGTLMEAVDRGWMRKRRSLVAPPDLRAVLRTLREVADGMAFLHSRDILHCDLTGNNVLLEAVEPGEDSRGFRARVCDFGLARAVAGAISTATFGTCSHMAPELMIEGMLSWAADVWSFGVLCWELYSGVRAYVGLRMPNIVFLVTSGKGALTLPEGAPEGYNALMLSCLNRDHTKRPSFEQLVGTIDALLAKGEQATVAPPPPCISTGTCKAMSGVSSVPAVSTPTLA